MLSAECLGTSCKHYPISFNYTCKHISESKLCIHKSKLDYEMPKQFVFTSEYKYMIISENVDSKDFIVDFRFFLCDFGHIILSISLRKKSEEQLNRNLKSYLQR